MLGTPGSSFPMGLFTRVTAAETNPAPVSSGGDDAPAASTGNVADDFLLWGDHYLARDTAMKCPPYRRAVNLVATTLANLALAQLDAKGNTTNPVPFLRQPDPKRTLAALMADTYADLAHWGVAYWLNPRYASEAGWRFTGNARKHASIELIKPEDVAQVRRDGYTIYRYDAKGVQHPIEVPVEAVIAYEAAAGHWLRDLAGTISTWTLIDQAVRMYARTPIPLTVVKNNGPRKTSEQVEKLLASVDLARQKRSTAYVGRDIELSAVGVDAAQMALTEARSQVVLDIARSTGIPPLYLAQGVQGSSLTYSNMTQQRLDLHAALQPFATAVEQRLSFDDVTGAGSRVQVDFGPFLRVDPTMRADLYSKLIPLGVMTIDEARSFEQLVPTNDTPTNTNPGGGVEGPNRTGTQ